MRDGTGRSPIQAAAEEFKSNVGRIDVAGLNVVDGQGNALCFIIFGRDGLTQVGGERSNAALARHIIADESNAVYG